MNTATSRRIPILPKTGDYVYCLEDLELAFPVDQLKEITNMWNEGSEIEFIAKKYRRDMDEVFLALFHQARRRKTKRPFAFRK
ncbi:hypothetical protein [Virgibacillus alimentarius]|uniref:hypothetical protein n=1 Tax=Virgibacillus alimentarius TaxID=698769 RepID=UPI000691C145|nr:hypothetical protein [Virgibacillus alimentarius]